MGSPGPCTLSLGMVRGVSCDRGRSGQPWGFPGSSIKCPLWGRVRRPPLPGAGPCPCLPVRGRNRGSARAAVGGLARGRGCGSWGSGGVSLVVSSCDRFTAPGPAVPGWRVRLAPWREFSGGYFFKCFSLGTHLKEDRARTLQRRAILGSPIRWGGWASSGWNP